MKTIVMKTLHSIAVRRGHVQSVEALLAADIDVRAGHPSVGNIVPRTHKAEVAALLKEYMPVVVKKPKAPRKPKSERGYRGLAAGLALAGTPMITSTSSSTPTGTSTNSTSNPTPYHVSNSPDVASASGSPLGQSEDQQVASPVVLSTELANALNRGTNRDANRGEAREWRRADPDLAVRSADEQTE
jgi:hypothetical protein